jgi:hypothetical protein|tara:strand:+ start:673 stop:915 length:243 start_codon:yes stop_codon:yes gene_type:complete
MYTVEFEPDASIITTLDQQELHEDVEVVITDDAVVYIRQYDEQFDRHDLIYMSHQQFMDIIAAYNSKEGAYYVTLERGSE